jgi:uncharacterized membrane protein YqjE
VSKRDRKNGVPNTATSIPLVDPHAMPPNPSIGDLVKDASAQVSTLVRAEVELAKAEITRDVKKGLTGSIFFIIALVVLLYSTFFMFFFLAELLDTWLWRWAAFLIVFVLMLVVTAVFALLGYLKVRRIRGPQQTIKSVKETTAALSPGLSKFAGGTSSSPTSAPAPVPPRIQSPASQRPAVAAAPYQRDAYPTETVEYGQTAYPTETVVYEETVYPAETVEYAETEYGETAYGETEYGETAYGETAYEGTVYKGTVYEDAEYTGYAEYEPTEYVESTEYTEYVEYVEPTGYPPGHDPTAAVYADTGLPVTPPDRLPGDPSGW